MDKDKTILSMANARPCVVKEEVVDPVDAWEQTPRQIVLEAVVQKTMDQDDKCFGRHHHRVQTESNLQPSRHHHDYHPPEHFLAKVDHGSWN